MSRLMAAMYDRAMAGAERAALRSWRRQVLVGASGTVVEIGAGTGSNLACYPTGVDRLILAEPDRFMRARVMAKVGRGESASVDASVIEVTDWPAASLELAAGTVDVVVCTLVLCTVPDPQAALAEFRRVLRPGGELRYLEHVGAIEDPKRFKWQRRLEPVWARLVDGCHLTRRTGQSILEAGFELVEERREDIPIPAPWINRTVRGVARTPFG